MLQHSAVKRSHQIRPGRLSRGLGFLYIASSAARLSTCILVLVGNGFLALLPLLLFVKHCYIFTYMHFLPQLSEIPFRTGTKETKKASRGSRQRAKYLPVSFLSPYLYKIPCHDLQVNTGK